MSVIVSPSEEGEEREREWDPETLPPTGPLPSRSGPWQRGEV